MDRREFLALTGRATLTAAGLSLTGCAGAALSSSITSSGAPAAPTGTPPPPTDADWGELSHQLTGVLVRPGDAVYASASQSFNPRFDGSHPAGVVYSASVSDVQRTIAFAHAHGLSLTPRSGGHSYAGYSTGPGVVCDVTGLADVVVRPDGTAVVGGGARLIDVYSGLAAHGVAIPAGSCATVGIAGLALGGGIGVVARKFGLTCDSVRELVIVTADGSSLTCNAADNPDLFWACRGGGGGNFGVVTSFTMATQPAPALTLFSLRWPWPAAADVIAGWQHWIGSIPDELWSNCHALSTPTPGLPTITVGGAFVGGRSELDAWLTSLYSGIGSSPTDVAVGTHSYLDAALIEAGCYNQSVASCHLVSPQAQGTLQREASLGRSDIFVDPLSPAAIAVIVDGVTQRQANPRATTVAGVALDALGGAVNRVASDGTAFVHRNALCVAQYNATWPASAAPDVVKSNIDGVNALYAAMRPYSSGYAYQNYIDPALRDWQHAYYGSNIERLINVKARYDPADFFRFAQSVPAR